LIYETNKIELGKNDKSKVQCWKSFVQQHRGKWREFGNKWNMKVISRQKTWTVLSSEANFFVQNIE